jgi:fructokinase
MTNLDLSCKRVVVFGEMLVDVFGEKAIPGGAPFNVARHLAAFGIEVCLISRIGTDGHADTLKQELNRFGLSAAGVQFDSLLPTGVVKVWEDETGHRFEILRNQAYDAIDGMEAVSLLKTAHADLVYHGSLAQRAESSRAALAATLATVRQCHPSSSHFVDLNLRQDGSAASDWRELTHDATVLKVSEEELLVICASLGIDSRSPANLRADEMNRIARVVFHAAPALQLLFVTLGHRGCVAYPRQAEAIWVATNFNMEVVDTVGAGDAFSSVVMLGMLADWPLQDIVERANAFAAAICCIRGSVPEDLAFYDRWIEAWTLNTSPADSEKRTIGG